jgi:hypothetical protein
VFERTSFLTPNEKGAVVGFDAIEEVASEGPFEPPPQGVPPLRPALKYSPTQPSVSAGDEDGGTANSLNVEE